MKRTFICLFALALFCGLAAAQGGWVYLGKAHVDGQHDHDDIKVGRSDGRFHFLQLRVVNARPLSSTTSWSTMATDKPRPCTCAM